MNKFDADFKRATNNRFPYIRYVRSEYSRSKNTLRLYFLAHSDAVDNGTLNEAKRKEIIQACASFMPDDVLFDIKFVKAFADNEVVRTKLMQFLSKEEPLAIKLIKPEDIKINIEEYSIHIEIRVVPTLYSIFKESDIKAKLIRNFEQNFIENIDVEFIERYVADEEKVTSKEKTKETYEKVKGKSQIVAKADGTIEQSNEGFSDLLDNNDIVVYDSMRLIKATSPLCIYGKGELNNMPNYICDIKETFDSGVICGTVVGFQKKDYANKFYNRTDVNKKGRFKRNTTDERLPIYIFSLNDTTGTFPVVSFPYNNNNEILDEKLYDGATIVCSGNLRRNNMGTFQMIANKIWLADLDFESISLKKPKKVENENYQIIFPEKYSELVQMDLLAKEKVIPPFLRGKTFVVFDLETTGLDTNKAMIVEIGAVKIVNGKIVETFKSLVNPAMKIPYSSMQIHGITDDDVRNMPEFHEILPDFYKFTRGSILVGQNIFNYDFPILNRLAMENDYIFDNEMLDTLVIAKNHLNLPKYNLEYLSKHLNVDLENAHRAVDDAVATAKCFIKLAELL